MTMAVNEISDETLAELAGGTEHGMSRQEVHAFRVALAHGDREPLARGARPRPRRGGVVSATIIATDEGTHSGPDSFRVYARADGSLLLQQRHGETVVSEETVERAGLGARLTKITDGYVRWINAEVAS